MTDRSLTGNILLYGDDYSLPEIRWITGFYVTDPTLLLVNKGDLHLIVSPLEKGRALKESRNAKVWTLEELGIEKENCRALAEWLPAVMKKFRIRSIDAPFNTPFGVTEILRAADIKVKLVKGAFCPEREMKTETEFKAIQKSQRATAKAMKCAFSIIEKSTIDEKGRLMLDGKPLTSERVRAAINHQLLDEGCVGKDTIVAGGRQAADPHNRGSGVLKAGEAIVIDIFPRDEKSGYFGDMTRTVCKGEPSAELLSLYNAVLKAQKAALQAVKAGVTGDAVHKTAQRVFDELGYKTDLSKPEPEGFIHGTGHGVGLEVHEAPRVSLKAPKLKAGNIITIEPGLYYPELGGVRIEDTVYVTEDGFRFTATCPKKFVIL
ncbi:M24 family metallopeptidase [Verrucomicrobiota bacterium]